MRGVGGQGSTGATAGMWTKDCYRGIIVLGGGAILWLSSTQRVAATHTTYTEYGALEEVLP